jgi:DNA-binding CsgD family transcriptional regulator
MIGQLDDSTRLFTEPLTDREKEIARLVALALTDKKISELLFISESAVRFHVNNIKAKLNLTNRVAICRWVMITEYGANTNIFISV